MNKKIGDWSSSFTPTLLPNGLYRHLVKLNNKDDPEGVCIY
jgi:hypothetical protein